MKSRPRIELPYDATDDDPSGAVVVVAKGIAADGQKEKARPSASTEDDMVGCFANGSISLARHTSEVVRKAEGFAGTLALSPKLRATIAFAAQHHDAGKADPRFQQWLSDDGRPGEPLAKSGRWRGNAMESKARAVAGVPTQWRHEVLSVRIAIQHLATTDSIDPALALYLIGTHHGHGRPFFPHHDPWDARPHEVGTTLVAAGPGPERLDFDWQGHDWAELVAALQGEYGVWGLAFLEAVLRLADHRASEQAP